MTGRNDGSYIALRLDAVSSAGTTGTIGVPLDGSVPFSIDVWARFNGLAARTVLLGQNSRFWLGTIGEQVTAQFGNGPVVRSDPSRQPLRDDTWHYICVTWDGASLRLYIDGLFNVMQGATPQGIGPAGATVMGDGLQGLSRTVRVYNTVLDAAAVSANMFNPPPSVTIVAAFDFSQVPPIDTGPAHLPITLSNNATQYAVSPALTLSAIGY